MRESSTVPALPAGPLLLAGGCGAALAAACGAELAVELAEASARVALSEGEPAAVAAAGPRMGADAGATSLLGAA